MNYIRRDYNKVCKLHTEWVRPEMISRIWQDFVPLKEVIDDAAVLTSLSGIGSDWAQPILVTRTDFDVMIISVYRKFYGKKLIGIFWRTVDSRKGTREENTYFKQCRSAALREHIQYMLKYTWCEVRDDLEKAICSCVDKWKSLVDPYELKENQVYKLQVGLDELHYAIPNFTQLGHSYRCAFGNIQFT